MQQWHVKQLKENIEIWKEDKPLNKEEMEKLISDLRYIDNPFNCPHGRPIIIKFTEYELDKKFRRIV
mgnify:CR=1 FL=1